MNLWNSVAGMVDVELTGADIPNTLAEINEAGIEVHRLQYVNELTCNFQISRRQLFQLRHICRKKGEKVRIISKRGIYWVSYSLLTRPVLVCGILFIFLAVMYIPSRVFFVEVEGNSSIPTEKIRSEAENCGIYFGVARRSIQSEKLKNALLSQIPQLQWAGINTKGCVATISVRERFEGEHETEEKIVSNIVADRDGYILSGTVTRGNPQFQIGQTVKSGQVLISGYTDCGISIRADRSQGEIYAQTNRDIVAVTPSNYLYRAEREWEKRKISIRYRKKRINLWKDSGISDATCGRMYKEYNITLPGGFQLPIALCVETYTSYTLCSKESAKEDAEYLLNRFADTYLLEQMVAGQILKKNSKVMYQEGVFLLTGEYICAEMIGREQQVEFGDTNGKSS